MADFKNRGSLWLQDGNSYQGNVDVDGEKHFVNLVPGPGDKVDNAPNYHLFVYPKYVKGEPHEATIISLYDRDEEDINYTDPNTGEEKRGAVAQGSTAKSWVDLFINDTDAEGANPNLANLSIRLREKKAAGV